MATASAINRPWIAEEFSKGIEAMEGLLAIAKERAASPPDDSLSVLYHEIASEDEHHRDIVETIAIRYGHTPARSVAGGIGETLGRLKERVGDMVCTPLHRVGHDLMVKANCIHWCNAWIEAFQAIGDSESAQELSTVLASEKAHRDALQQGLNRMVMHGATSEATHHGS